MLPLKVISQEPKCPADFLVGFTHLAAIQGSQIFKACLASAVVIVEKDAKVEGFTGSTG
jgi:hypothetical protein